MGSSRIRLHEECVVEEDLPSRSGLLVARFPTRKDLLVEDWIRRNSYQYVCVLANVEARMRLDDLLDRRSRVGLLARCHCRRGIPILLLVFGLVWESLGELEMELLFGGGKHYE